MISPINKPKTSWQGRRPSHSGFTQVLITLTYLRTNISEAALAEIHHTSQPTVSRIISHITALFAIVFADYAPNVDELDERESLLIDGTLVPSWSWKPHREDYSGKHRTTGRNLQIACSLDGQLRWISDDLPGSVHDSKAIRIHGMPNAYSLVADKGYIGLGMITPIRRVPGQSHLEEWQKDYNQQIGAIRAPIERCIAQLKTWIILTTDYRRPWETHTQTITAVIGLHFYRLSL